MLSRLEALETKREGIFVMPKVHAHYTYTCCMNMHVHMHAPHEHRMGTAWAPHVHVCMCMCVCVCVYVCMCVCTASSVYHKERIEILSTSVMTAYMGQLVVEPPEAAERARALDVRAGDAASCRKQCEIACEKEL